MHCLIASPFLNGYWDLNDPQSARHFLNMMKVEGRLAYCGPRPAPIDKLSNTQLVIVAKMVARLKGIKFLEVQ